MEQAADIIIIGGGVMGTSIAYHLARQGAGRVVLLERGALCGGTTGHSGAIVRQHYSHAFTIRMARASLQIFQNFGDVVGGNSGFITTGLLVLSDEAGAEGLRANVELQRQQGVDTRLLTPQEIAEVAPDYRTDDATLACYEAETGVADPVATTHCFAQRARDYGAMLLEGVTVTRLLAHNERISGVETTQGEIRAPLVVLAANVWSRSLAQTLGIDLPITATRHLMLALRRPGDATEYGHMHPVCFDGMQDMYMRPDTGGVTLIGSTRNVDTASDPDHYAQGLSEEEIAHFHTDSAHRFPALARASTRGGWAGLYDDTPDFHPILGRLPHYTGLYCAAGFSGHGFKLSPMIGQYMAELLLTGTTPTDMQPFAYERFAEGKQIQPRYGISGVLG